MSRYRILDNPRCYVLLRDDQHFQKILREHVPADEIRDSIMEGLRKGNLDERRETLKTNKFCKVIITIPYEAPIYKRRDICIVDIEGMYFILDRKALEIDKDEKK